MGSTAKGSCASPASIDKETNVPSGYVKIAIKDGHRNSDLPSYKMVVLSIVTLVYQRVTRKSGRCYSEIFANRKDVEQLLAA